jgi:hypothetical protein
MLEKLGQHAQPAALSLRWLDDRTQAARDRRTVPAALPVDAAQAHLGQCLLMAQQRAQRVCMQLVSQGEQLVDALAVQTAQMAQPQQGDADTQPSRHQGHCKAVKTEGVERVVEVVEVVQGARLWMPNFLMK